MIDLIIVSKPSRFNETLVYDTGLSDFHKMICINSKAHAPIRVKRKIHYRSFKKFDENKFCEEVSYIPFHVASIFDDVNDITWCHEKLFSDVIESHAPLKQRILKKESLPFMNSALRKNIHKRNQLKNKFWKNKTRQNWNNYRVMRNKVNSLLRTSEISFFRSKSVNSSTPSEFWKLFKPYISSKTVENNSILLKEDGSVVSKPTRICDIFKDYYSTIADDIGISDSLSAVDVDGLDQVFDCYKNHSSVLKIRTLPRNVNEFIFDEVKPETVYGIMKKLNTKKSVGYDNVSPYFIKISASSLAYPICNIINSCFTQGIYPDCYKMSETSPLHKGKDKNDKCNYRPVSCPTAISKIVEKVICIQVSNYFEKLFHEKLSAYRQGIGCEQVLINAVEDWKYSLDCNKIVAVLLMDLSKAFDSLPHRLLISKLYAYGISKQACTLLASYLFNRKQRIKYHGYKSEWFIVKKGIPQGSILGPLLYNIFINDLLYLINDYYYNYADDNTIAVIGNEVSPVLAKLKLNSEICVNWFERNMMKTNPNKFQLMVLDRTNSSICESMNINNVTVNSVNEVKLLGVTIDVKLSFISHVNNICKKAAKNMNILKRLSYKVKSKQDRIALMNAFVFSCFTYCPLLWHFTTVTMSRMLDKIYERCLKFILNDSDFTIDSELLLERSNCDSLTLWRLKKIAIFMYKCYHDLSPEYLNRLAVPKINNHNLRDNRIVCLKRFNTIQYGYRSLSYGGCKLWNSIPNLWKNSSTIVEFTDYLKLWKCFKANCYLCSSYVYHQ